MEILQLIQHWDMIKELEFYNTCNKNTKYSFLQCKAIPVWLEYIFYFYHAIIALTKKKELTFAKGCSSNLDLCLFYSLLIWTAADQGHQGHSYSQMMNVELLVTVNAKLFCQVGLSWDILGCKKPHIKWSVLFTWTNYSWYMQSIQISKN